MRKLKEILIDESEDRYIFVCYNSEGEVDGLNFHQGIDFIQFEYFEPCEKLTKIYKHFDYHKTQCSDEQRRLIDDSIKLYLDLFL